METIRTAVIGCGHIGRYHLEKYARSPHCRLVALVETDHRRRLELGHHFGIPSFASHREILGKVDAVSVAVPTCLHHSVTSDCLRAGIHALVEKPISVTLDEADNLIHLAKTNDRVLQVGQLERFNPVTLKIEELVTNPRFIECHRLAPFNPRGTDVDVVLDLMIHDIDLLLNLVPSPLVALAASGAPVIGDSVDIANARLHFANGCAANVTASRISLKCERKMRFFQKDTYVSADFHNRRLTIHSKQPDGDPSRPITSETVTAEGDALELEIESFLDTIATGGRPKVSGADGRHALAIAHEIRVALASGEPWRNIAR